MIFKNCSPFIDCISKLNNTQIDNAKKIDTVMPKHDLIEYSNNYWKTGSLWQYYRDEPALNPDGAIIHFLILTIIVLHLNLNKK